jgi:hypothetical protein
MTQPNDPEKGVYQSIKVKSKIKRLVGDDMVGATGIEPVTPPV